LRAAFIIIIIKSVSPLDTQLYISYLYKKKCLDGNFIVAKNFKLEKTFFHLFFWCFIHNFCCNKMTKLFMIIIFIIIIKWNEIFNYCCHFVFKRWSTILLKNFDINEMEKRFTFKNHFLISFICFYFLSFN